MTAVLECVQLLLDDAAVRWHRWRRDVHDEGLAAAVERRRARIARWAGRL